MKGAGALKAPALELLTFCLDIAGVILIVMIAVLFSLLGAVACYYLCVWCCVVGLFSGLCVDNGQDELMYPNLTEAYQFLPFLYIGISG